MVYLGKRHLTILNSERLPEIISGPHTICVTGNPRGGTSAVALFLRELGIFMGDEIDPLNQEDLRLQNTRTDAAEFKRIVQNYDERHDVWGFKLPLGSKMSQLFIPVLRNPILIIMTRNPVSVIRSRFARKRSVDDQQSAFLDTLEQLYRDGMRLHRFSREQADPMIFVEYEKLLSEPGIFAREFVDTIGWPIDNQRFERAIAGISTPGYRRFSGDPDVTPLEPVRVARTLYR